MSDEEYIIRRETEDVEEEEPVVDTNEQVFENEFRLLVIFNSGLNEDGGITVTLDDANDMEEMLVRKVKTLEDINEFFDSFDSTVAIPNEGHLKYEVGSDGLCVVLVDTKKLKEQVVEFVHAFEAKGEEKQLDNEENDGDDRQTKRRK